MNLDISTTLDFVRLRTEKTRSVQAAIASSWTWIKTLAQWDADLAQTDGATDGTLAQKAIAADAVENHKRGKLKTRYADMHALTLTVVGVFRARARANKELRANVDELSARGDTPRQIEEEGEELLATWKVAFGEDFLPAPGVAGVTYAALKALYEGAPAQGGNPAVPSLRALKTEYRDARAIARREVGLFNELVVRLEDECVQWYGEATAIFPTGTNQGDLIRGEVPTEPPASGGSGPSPGPGDGGSGGGGESSSSEDDGSSESSEDEESTSSEESSGS